MARKRKKQAGRRPLPDRLRRVPFTVRLPGELLEEFRELCDELDPGTQTKVIEDAVRKFIKRRRSEGRA